MTDPVELCISRLRGVKKNGVGWTALCPSHDDRTPSLSLSRGDDGRALFYCHAGCSYDAIVSAMGLDKRDLFATAPCSSSRRPITVPKATPTGKAYQTDAMACHAAITRQGRRFSICYEYHDGNGDLDYLVLRWSAGDQHPKKVIRPVSRWPDGWRVCHRPDNRPLFNLPKLVDHEAGDIYVFEGEACAFDAGSILRDEPIVATTWIGGTNAVEQTDWTPLRGKRIRVFPDNDRPGRRVAEQIVAKLNKMGDGTNAAIAILPDLPNRGDVVDFLAKRRDAGDSDAEIVEAIRSAEVIEIKADQDSEDSDLRIKLTCVADVETAPISWLWPGRIASNKLTMWTGDPDSGKTTVALDLAARITSGTKWPDGASNSAGDILIVSSEDTVADVLRPRLEQCGADLHRVHFADDILIPNAAQVKATMRQLPNLRMVILDPLSAFLGDVNSHRDADVRRALKPLSAIAEDLNVAFVGIAHLNKNSEGNNAMYRSMGSLAFVAASRATFGFVKDPDSSDGRRLMLVVKNNLSPMRTGMAYRLMPSVIDPNYAQVAWEPEPVDIDINDVLVQKRRRPPQWQECADWLKDELEGRTRLSSDIEAAAVAAGFTLRVLKTARKNLGVVAKKADFGGGWVVSLPTDESEPLDEGDQTPN